MVVIGRFVILNLLYLIIITDRVLNIEKVENLFHEKSFILVYMLIID